MPLQDRTRSTTLLGPSLLGAAALMVFCFVGSPAVLAAQLVSSGASCIDIPRQDTSDGTPLQLFHCHGSPNQNWIVSGGTISGENGVCLDILGSQPKDGAQVIIVHCNGAPSQRWQVANGQLIGLGNKCLDLQGGSTTDRTPLILATCNQSSPSQQWTVQ
jgi:Ricin-type beta-trefoil lectin domain